MPASFATLPENVLTRIVDLFRDRNTARKSGKDITRLGISLTRMCRSLLHFARRLIWSGLVLEYNDLDPEKMSVFADFESNEHLHPLIETVVVSGDCSKTSAFDPQVSPSRIAQKILRYCPNLHHVGIVVLNLSDAQATTIFTYLSALPHLRYASMLNFALPLNHAFTQALLTGFPVLNELHLRLRLPSTFDPRTTYNPQYIRSPIRELELDAEGSLETVAAFLGFFEATLDKCLVEKVTFGPGISNSVSTAWLTTLPALRNVSLDLRRVLDVAAALTTMTRYLQRLQQVLTFTINRDMTRQEHLNTTKVCPFPISTLLSSIPPNMYIFSIKGIHFRGPLSYPKLRIKRSLLSQTEGPTVQCYFEESVSKQLVRLKKMRDSNGVFRWYHIVEVSLPFTRQEQFTRLIYLNCSFHTDLRPTSQSPPLSPVSSIPFILDDTRRT